MSQIRYADRLFLAGRTGSGKSTVARELFLSSAPPRLVVDPNDSSVTAVPGAVTVLGLPPGTDDDQAVRHLLGQLEAHAGADTLRVVPGDPGRVAEVDAVYRWCFAHYPRWIWLDEAGDAASSTGARSPWLRKVLTQGRKRQIGHLACHTRPREVDRNLIAQSEHVLIWRLGNPDDVGAVAKIVGRSSDELDRELRELPPFGFLWYDLRGDTLTACPALELEA